MMPATPQTRNFPVRFKTCPICGNAFGVCRTDLLADPQLWAAGSCWLKECHACVLVQIHGVPQAAELIQSIEEHRAVMHGLAVRYGAAAG